MDYSKLAELSRQIATENANLTRQKQILQSKINEIDNVLRLKMEGMSLMRDIHSLIFQYVSQGKRDIVLFINLTDTCKKLDKEIIDMHTFVQYILTNCGLKEPQVETLEQYKLKCSNEKHPKDEECSTVISFSV